METPYNVYGGLQDNGSWAAPSTRAGRHREPALAQCSAVGDGFWAFVDPNDPDITYVEYQGGNMLRVRQVDRRDEGDQALSPRRASRSTASTGTRRST